MNKKQEKYLLTFTVNMREGISYYHNLFNGLKHTFEDSKSVVLKELEISEITLHHISLEIEHLKSI